MEYRYDSKHREYMKLALLEAEKAFAEGEIPVGAVLVKDGAVIACGRNNRETKKNVCGHAEINAIAAASEQLGDWRLGGCSLYVTMEPCPMCMGAIIQSRISSLFYGCDDPESGSCRSVINISASGISLGKLEIYDGILREESAEIVKRHFKRLRSMV